jgi:hypothetical protein
MDLANEANARLSGADLSGMLRRDPEHAATRSQGT